MTVTAKDLRAASDHLRRDLEALSALEDEKRTLSFDDPRLPELAHQVEEVAARVLAETADQADLTETISDEGATGSIDTTHRPLADILAEWRAVERRAASADPGSAEAKEVAALLRHVRAEYQAAHAAAAKRDEG